MNVPAIENFGTDQRLGRKLATRVAKYLHQHPIVYYYVCVKRSVDM